MHRMTFGRKLRYGASTCPGSGSGKGPMSGSHTTGHLRSMSCSPRAMRTAGGSNPMKPGRSMRMTSGAGSGSGMMRSQAGKASSRASRVSLKRNFISETSAHGCRAFGNHRAEAEGRSLSIRPDSGSYPPSVSGLLYLAGSPTRGFCW